MADKDKGGGLRFDLMEFAGSLGDLGTLIPIMAGMILMNHLSPTSVMVWVGLFYVFSGLFYKLPIPVQPLKAVGAIAIANPETITAPVIGAAGMIFGAILLLLSLSGAMRAIAKLFTKPVIRGIQLGIGLILMRKGFQLIAATDIFMSAADGSAHSSPAYANLIIGVIVFIMVLALLNNRRLPAAVAAVAAGIAAGIAFGGLPAGGFSWGPAPAGVVIPTARDFGAALLLLVLPQIPLTIGNAAIGAADTCLNLFPDAPETKKATPARFALSMGLINIPAGLMGAMPMCHGAGGLAAHYRFGARTGGSSLIIGAVFIVLALAFGKAGLGLLTIIPNSVLGTLLAFAGIELALMVRDIDDKAQMFVAILVAGIGLAGTNMAWAFLAGIVADLIIRKAKIEI